MLSAIVNTYEEQFPQTKRNRLTLKERIVLTYLATGVNFKQLGFTFMRGASTIGKIIANTRVAIWTFLQPLYMPVPTENDWKRIGDRYNLLWNFAHCVGSVDGKHFRVHKFANTGSRNINYNGYFSVQLMACADADGYFTTIDVGDLGRNSDGGVFRTSRLGRWLDRGGLRLPLPEQLPENENGPNIPYFLCGDEAFPLSKYFMRPYPKRVLTNKKRIFNYRLSRARKSIECTFGMLVSKFTVFESPMVCSKNTAISIIKTACILHNYIRKTEGYIQKPSDFTEYQDDRIIERENEEDEERVRNLTTASGIRDYLSDYFFNTYTLPWQNNYIV
ncbi:hypothetical protein RI129_002860 [Pyrocoelia pectoralis]|uniref:DDE Tnp4 domain-containing protein n=1 Tax=Pyrocoelia pectoralis TaxID=417401 RepID=A0AAN7VPB9_9COLE